MDNLWKDIWDTLTQDIRSPHERSATAGMSYKLWKSLMPNLRSELRVSLRDNLGVSIKEALKKHG